MKLLKKIPYFLLLLLIIFFSLAPFVWAFSVSIKPSEIANTIPPVMKFKPTLEAYIALFTEHHFSSYLINSLLTALSVLAISLIVGSLAAYSLARFRVGGRGLTFGILVVQMIPPMVITFPLYLTIRSMGLIDSISGLVIAQLAYQIPFVVWVMRQFFMQIPTELDEAARIDGASNFRLFFQIILPISAPGLISAGIFAFLGSWNDLLFPLMLTNTKAQTLTLASANFVTVYKTMWADVDASIFLMSLPPILLVLFMRKYIVSGLVGGSVKG